MFTLSLCFWSLVTKIMMWLCWIFSSFISAPKFTCVLSDLNN